MATSVFEQAAYRIRFERGERGLRSIVRGCAVVVVVDVLSFSTAADIAVTAGAAVFATPYFSDARLREMQIRPALARRDDGNIFRHGAIERVRPRTRRLWIPARR